MKISESDLKRLFREYIAGKIPDSRENCPPFEDLINCFDAKASRRRKKRILDHLSKCDLCAQEFEFTMEARRYEVKIAEQIRQVSLSDEKEFEKRKTSILFLRQPVQFALLFLGGIITFLALNIFLRNIGGVIERGRGPSSIELLQPTRVVRETPLLFRWNQVRDADYYVLELFSESLNPLWKSSHLSASEIYIPQEIASQLKKNTNYFWMITVFTKKGTQLESNLEYFVITE